MTMMRPFRLIILHFSHIGFTEGLTFMIFTSFCSARFIAVPLAFYLLGAPGDAPLGEIVGGNFHRYLIAGQDADVVHAQLAGDMRQDDMPAGQPHLELGIWQCFYYLALDLNDILL